MKYAILNQNKKQIKVIESNLTVEEIVRNYPLGYTAAECKNYIDVECDMCGGFNNIIESKNIIVHNCVFCNSKFQIQVGE
jgi:hypothetical protein